MNYVPKLQHHYEDMPKQRHAAKLGMWLFIGSEVLFFSGLFTLYAAYRAHHLEIFQLGVDHNNLLLGTINTVILVAGSISVSCAVNALRSDLRGLAILLTSLTAMLGVAYLVIKGTEWGAHFAEGIYPGGNGSFFVENPEPAWAIFFTLYYALTGFHVIHVTVGVCILAWTAWWIHRDVVGAEGSYKLTIVSLYWHLVDMIWLFLWTLFYLLGSPK